MSMKELKCGYSHPKLLVFHEHFRQFHGIDSDPIFSRSSIDLPFQVKKKILNFNQTKYQEGCVFVDEDLVANHDSYYLEVDAGGEDFEDQRT